METLTIKNKRIIDFYNKYKTIDIEKINIMMIDIYEEMMTNITGDINKNMSKEILLNIKTQGQEMNLFKNELNTIIKSNIELYKSELQTLKSVQTLTNTNIISELGTLKDILNKLNNEISNSVTSRFYEMRTSYIDDLKLIMEKQDTENLLKIIDKIEKENNKLIDKTGTIINDIIPKTQIQYYNQYNNTISDFKEDMNKNINYLRKEYNENRNDITLDKINLIITDKYNILINTIQQNILSYISTSEDRIKNNINDIKDITTNNKTNQDGLNENLQLFLNQYKIGSKKGEFGENMLHNLLTTLFPSGDVINTTGQTSSGDFILNRPNLPTILFENKHYDSVNVPKREIDKFLIDVQHHNCSGILMSQKSGIALKHNFEIDINNNNVLVYIHYLNYSPEKILLAVDIIDNLTQKLTIFNNKINGNISDDDIHIINEQYQLFIQKKEDIITQINDNSKKIISQINELELSKLNIILSQKFASTKIFQLKCSVCNTYTASNNKALSNHVRKCKNKIKPCNIEVSTDSDDTPTNSNVIIDTSPIIINDNTTVKKNKNNPKLNKQVTL